MPPSGKSSAETPLMRQYLDVKERYPDCIVFFRVGDFYEMFFDDAVTVARAIDLTLTTRDKGREDAVPMCGVPHHAARLYLGKLVELGFKVAVCDQVEDPKVAKGIVKREVTRVVTPGVLVDEEQLDAKTGCYLAAIYPWWRDGGTADGPHAPGTPPDRIGVAHLDVSTGEFAACELSDGELDDELARIAPREVLVPEGLDESFLRRVSQRRALTVLPDPPPVAVPARQVGPWAGVAPGVFRAEQQLLDEAVGRGEGDVELAAAPSLVRAAAACVRYARVTQPTGTLPLVRLVVYRPSQHLVLDEAAQVNLELFATLSGARKRGSLLGVLDETRTAMGGRLLRRWIGAPLADVARIRRRHDAVEWLVERAALRDVLRAELGEVYDLERLCGRATLGVATPRDLAALRRSLERLPAIARVITDGATGSLAGVEIPELLGPRSGDDLAGDVASDIAATLVDEPPAQWTQGGIIRRGASPALDELVDISDGGKGAILAIEVRERERTGISSLKVRYNKVFGYYLEITRSNLARVPTDYTRKQTLANCERYTTPELAEYEAKVLGAEERRVALENELFASLRTRVAAAHVRLAALAEKVAQLDALASLAEVAHASGYVRPEVDDGVRLEIVDGRHPVVEKLAAAGRFVPNDTTLDPDDGQLLVVTGPNMAGKSTVMRQVALISLLAQAGSFVPATRARLGLVDRIFTRVGASDNLARGESTFMVEMRETAHILSHATRRSLVLLDEIGRGTSTYDGVSIAWAVAEHLHDAIGCKTMFATHYHELTALARTRPRVRNLQVAVEEWPRAGASSKEHDIVFLHKLVDGGASRSYGIQVARLAGLPRGVIDRARGVLASLERGEDVFGRGATAGAPQMELFAAAGLPAASAAATASAASAVERAILDELRAVDPDDLSPRAAHALVTQLRARLQS